MFVRNFKVKGKDVNDFMVMQNFAYLSHSSTLIKVFLLENGFSVSKLNALKIGWQKMNDTLINKKHLMFTESFSMRLNFICIKEIKGETRISVDFYNTKNELCATLTTEIQWIDYNSWEIIAPPKKIAQYFFKQEHLRRVV